MRGMAENKGSKAGLMSMTTSVIASALAPWAGMAARNSVTACALRPFDHEQKVMALRVEHNGHIAMPFAGACFVNHKLSRSRTKLLDKQLHQP